MTAMGKYCKAYPVSRLRQFAGWHEKSENLRPPDITPDEPGADAGADSSANASASASASAPQAVRQLSDDDYLFVQENLIVTDSIYIDEHIIFDEITPEWEAFCKHDLEFEIPDFEAESTPVAETA